MDLKFTFAKPAHTNTPNSANPQQLGGKPLPFSTNSSTSSELFLRLEITQTAGKTAVIARAVTGDGHEYAHQAKQLTADPHPLNIADIAQNTAALKQLASACRSAIARAVAELDEKLTSAITALQLPASAACALTQEGFLSADARTTQSLQLRAGIIAGTLAEVL